MKKRLLSLVLAILMLMSLVPISASAATYNGSTYSTDYANWKQGSAPWGSKKLGDLCTMADSGCLITSIAILMAKSGAENPESFCPGTLRDRYESKGFVSHNSSSKAADGNLSYAAYNQSNQPKFYQSGSSDFHPTPFSEIYSTIKSKLDAGYYAIVNVNYGGHFVAVNYCSGGEVYIYDPGYSGRTKLSVYDGGIEGATYFKANVHTHSYGSAWKNDSTNHWHECSCGAKSSTAAHTYGSWSTTKAATCTATGTQTRKCTVCGYTQSQTISATGHKTELKNSKSATCTETGYTGDEVCTVCGSVVKTGSTTAKLNHKYASQIVPATCIENEYTIYTCEDCGDSYKEYNTYSDWTTTKPTGVDESKIETKTQYRSSDHETKTSYNASESGWTQVSSIWEKSGTGSVQYVKSWPSGFSTSNSLYSTYNKTPKSASETATTKTTIDSDKITGYLYYHWCRGTYTEGPINRATSKTKSGEFTSFHAFYNTKAPSSLTASSDGDGSYTFSNGSCCKDSHWYYPVSVYTQSYTTYKKLFTYERWTAWSDWSDSQISANDKKKVETRTLYRYVAQELGEHEWDEGVTTTPATCTESGVTTFTCSKCNDTKTEVIEAFGHDYIKGVCTRCGAADPDYHPVIVGVGSNTVVQGETVTVPVYISDNIGFAGFTFTIDYDASQMTLTNITKGEVLKTSDSGMFTKNVVGNTVNYNDVSNITSNGVLLNLTFAVNEEAQPGNYNVTISLKDGKASNFVNENSKSIVIESNEGTVTIEKLHVHDYDSVITAPTCTEQGYTTHKCACGDSYVDDYVDPLGHDYVNGVCTHCGDVKELAAPVVTVSNNATTGKPVLTWNAVDGAAKYEVYRSTSENGKYSKLSTTTKTSATNSSAEEGITYYYKVVAVAEDGSKSADSAIVKGACASTSTLAAPVVKISNNATNGKPMLTWNAVDGAVKYEVYRSTSENGKYSKLNTIAKTSTTNSSAEEGITYYYKVVAVAEDGTKSAESAVVSGSCIFPAPVVSISLSNGQPKLTWNAVDGAVKYEVYRATSENGRYSKLSTTTKTSATNASAVVGTTYYYKVVAVMEDGTKSAESEIVSATCIETCAAPEVKISLSNGHPKLTWEAVDGAVKYEVYRSTSEDGKYSKMSTTEKTSATNMSAVAGTTYFFKVKAISENGDANSDYSEIVSITAC